MYKDARKSVNLSIDEAAFRLHVGTRTLTYYESQEREPGPGIVLGMSRVYRQPSLTVKYCKEHCPIGQAYSYEILNNIDMSVPAVILKLISELREAAVAIEYLTENTVNKRSRADFTDDEWHKFMDAMQELIDVEHNIEILKIAIEGLTEETTLIAELTARHNEKCRNRGYAGKKERPLVRAAR